MNGSYAGTDINGQEGTWTIVSGPNVPTIVSPHSQNTAVTNLIQGTYVFRWTVTGPCVSGSPEVTVTVPAPTANISGASITGGGNQVFCDPTVTSTVLSGSIPQYINETVQWTQTGGPAVIIVSSTSSITSVTGLASPNTYTFLYTISNDTTVCSSAASVTVSYDPNAPTLAITTPSPLILGCNVSTATIDFTDGGSGTTQYQILSGPTTTGMTFPTSWINAGGSPLTINGLLSTGTYEVQMRRVTTTGDGCITPFSNISIVTSVNAVVANAGTSQLSNCNVDTTHLIGNDPTVGGGTGQGTWSQVSGPSVIILTNPHSPNLGIGNLQPNGLYVFRWVITGGTVCPTSQDNVHIYTAGLTPTDANAGPNQTNICYQTPIYLDAMPPTYIFELGTWSVSPSSGIVFSNIHDPHAIVTGQSPFTTYTFTWTVANGCGSKDTSMTVDVIDNVGPIIAHAGPDQCLGLGTTSTTLAGNNPFSGYRTLDRTFWSGCASYLYQ